VREETWDDGRKGKEREGKGRGRRKEEGRRI
jgi:hypothetical protein